MINSINPKKTDVLILCGGLGRRLSEVTKDIPKPMAKINNEPFLDILIKYVSSFGFKRFLFCTGYKKEVIENHYRSYKGGLEIIFSREDKLLGTGGAVKNAKGLIKSDKFLVMNGDSFSKIDLKGFLKFHIKKNALISIAVVKVRQRKDDVGLVSVNDRDEIIHFSEKNDFYGSGYVNAGSYIFDKKVFSYMPDKSKFSLEYDLFPEMVNKGIYGYIVDAELIDIGIPERLEKAKRFFIKDFKR